jgi:tRNA (cytidine/uridine-2'-O-)-methyltransferase
LANLNLLFLPNLRAGGVLTIAASTALLKKPIQSTPTVFHIVLHTPEIPNNTGTIGRTAVATGCPLHLIRPLGFDFSEKSLRRAGLDYWPNVDLHIHGCWADFLTTQSPKRLWACTARATHPTWSADFLDGDYLLFGRESDGLPAHVRSDVARRWGERAFIGLPQQAGIRSLNLACATTAVVYEALRQRDSGGC